MNAQEILTVTAWQFVSSRRQARRVSHHGRLMGHAEYWDGQARALLSVLRISLKRCPRKIRMAIGAEIRKELNLTVPSTSH